MTLDEKKRTRQLARARYQQRRNQGVCENCMTPVAINPATGRRPHQCPACRARYAEAHRLAAETYRTRRAARGLCVQCSQPVTRKNPRTQDLVRRCDKCSTLQKRREAKPPQDVAVA